MTPREELREQLVNFFESDPLTGVTPESNAEEALKAVDMIVKRCNDQSLVDG